MLLSHKAFKTSIFKRLPDVKSPKFVVFCDFDETYYPHDMDELKRANMKLLEAYLYDQAHNGNLVIGWVTGSSIESVTEKMKKGCIQYLPHFIASGLGTEMAYFHDDGTILTDKKWEEKIEYSGFKPEKVEKVINILKQDYGTFLKPQTQLGNSKYKFNFYYTKRNEMIDIEKINNIKSVAKQYQLGVNVNQCNPLAGDPENCYDVDFIPMGSGKDEVVKFILDKYNLRKEKAIAFGDSGNDLKMLKAVHNGFLMQNATDEAKQEHDMLTQGEYSIGILDTLVNFIK